ncbi:hypothetical protein Q4603_05145 [Zobellia galactanivorans]|nr:MULTISPECIES: hypothetical protein [Zobellia]MBU3027091.1 hypothetical protein [Zobellia galactanivorans]MDO6807979.1 hypothetical protein [Zobellia galactanivorans]OWW24878.1 hypothetical protein B4Q04_13540 [Zobellia sp. OII3]
MATPKSYEEFKKTWGGSNPPSDLSEALKAMWFAANDNWEASHDIAQEMYNETGSWIHAYLHRVEGDKFNAGYWYRKAGRSYPQSSLEQEHQEITEYLLGR